MILGTEEKIMVWEKVPKHAGGIACACPKPHRLHTKKGER